MDNKDIVAIIAAGNNSKAPSGGETRVPVQGSEPVITPENNSYYQCGTITSLTVTSSPATGAWSVEFTSGATPTTTTFPATVLGLEDFAAEANTIYEINVLDNRAVVGSWAVSANE